MTICIVDANSGNKKSIYNLIQYLNYDVYMGSLCN